MAVQRKAELHRDPVLVGDSEADGSGASIYGTVLYDGGVYRMWYQAWSKDWTGEDVALVGYAESDNGVEWRKPKLNIAATHGPEGNLTNMGFHSPSVFIDPTGVGKDRYRATGFLGASAVAARGSPADRGYYTARSADGLNWELDARAPVWPGGDVITSVFHPGQGRGVVALKQTVRYRSVPRRSIWSAGFEEGRWTSETRALVPDDFDDVCASARGFTSGDYYGMGMQAAAGSTVGFIWQFRHTLPRTASTGWESGVFGSVGVSLAFQDRAGGLWQHAPGRLDFIPHDALPWAEGGFYTSSCPVECGGEHRLYLCGARHTHGWYLDSSWKRLERWKNELMNDGLAAITYASWPKWRLFGLRSDPAGAIDIRLGKVGAASRVLLNFECDPTGSIRVEVLNTEGRSLKDSVPMTGESLGRPAVWKDGERIRPGEGGEAVTIRVHMERATVWAFEVVG